jgi:hypothetical protein
MFVGEESVMKLCGAHIIIPRLLVKCIVLNAKRLGLPPYCSAMVGIQKYLVQ